MNSRLNNIVDWPGLAEQASWSIARLATNCQISERELRRYFHWKFRVPPHVWLLRQRLRLARKVLEQGGSAKEAAALAGFKDAGNFSRAFKTIFEATPCDVRQRTLPARVKKYNRHRGS
jgi:AraC-like DNA-binding protein